MRQYVMSQSPEERRSCQTAIFALCLEAGSLNRLKNGAAVRHHTDSSKTNKLGLNRLKNGAAVRQKQWCIL